ncbi:PREDICTED: uncharacterized protein LOC106329344 [Brassica oleracea var. oleracea]|uniref:uncharacterized protein LOC106329344 n=1 Tax=Brassica oleracea var. oleracea TaxID=109376 RepID=UPI0006A6AD0E|nr:PREDICTED: uncharacterized protein LOC106329344 [Brassica oleracea var. oleracea]
MDIFCWNVRGFNDKIKRCGFRKWFRLNKPIFGGLLETHVSSIKAVSIINRVFPSWHYDCNYEFSDLGKIWLLWHPSVSVSVIHKSLQSITCKVKLPFVSAEFVVTLVYGSNCRKVRRELWSELCYLSTSPSIAQAPWTVLGDFNQILDPSEHSSASAASSSRGMRDFLNCSISSALSDLPFCGNTFTWSNKQGASVVAKKLDRILVNDMWLSSFPNALGVFGDPGISDHSPCCVFLDTSRPKLKHPFKFFSMLNANPEFKVIISECWKSLPFQGTSMRRVSKKLKELKSIIRTFSKDNYFGIEKRVTEAFEELSHCQHALLSRPSPQAGLNERKAYEKWPLLAKAEESFFQQRSHVNWLGKGDSSTSFYHRYVKARAAQNQILFLQDVHGNVIDTKEGIMNMVLDYYENFLGGPSLLSTSTFDELSQLLQFRCSLSVVDLLQAPILNTDIQEVSSLCQTTSPRVLTVIRPSSSLPTGKQWVQT